jgi:glycine oxidase
MQILVVGGGIQGLTASIALAGEGHLVQLVERERTGSRASWVAAGLLTPSTPWVYPRPLIDLCQRSEASYVEFVADLKHHTGIDAEHEDAGMLYPQGLGCDASTVLDQTDLRRQLGFDIEQLDRAELDVVQPGLGDALGGAAWQRSSARVRPPRLLRALRARAQQLGVHVLESCSVKRLERVGPRLVGVRLDSGQLLEADLTVLAAGAWSGALAASAGVAADVRPVRGQILLLRGPPGLLGPTINDGLCYLVPRRDGRILVGSTMEDVGFDAVTTPQALSRLRAMAAQLLPASRQMIIENDWAGLRPGTPDRLPIIGVAPDCDGLILATGHFRNGILLAPITARIVADLVAGRRPEVELSPFAPRALDERLSVVDH